MDHIGVTWANDLSTHRGNDESGFESQLPAKGSNAFEQISARPSFYERNKSVTDFNFQRIHENIFFNSFPRNRSKRFLRGLFGFPRFLRFNRFVSDTGKNKRA